ncbi:MAG: MBL fold metallo-hydrolase [Christensenellales bacterium]
MIKILKTTLNILLLITTVILVACTTVQNSDTPADNRLQIYFINVGKGDAALIGLPDNKWFMIDVGHADKHEEVIRVLKDNNVKELEAIFISHPHKDHVSALKKVLEHVKCEIIYSTPVEFKDHSPMMREMAGDVPIQTLSAGDKLGIGDLKIDIIGPNGVFAEENDNSIVIMLDWKGKKALFTGDQQINAEKALLKKGWKVKCDILKVGHHGQDTASSSEFLEKAAPDYCIVTNKYKGKKYDKVVDRLSEFGSKVFVLGTTGTLLFEIEEGNIRFFGIE